MSEHERSLLLGVRCDKPGCAAYLEIPDPDWRTYSAEFPEFLREHGWTRWVGRSQRHYCPSHGPAAGTKMRELP